MSNLDNITQKILDDAQAEVQSILEEANAKKQAIVDGQLRAATTEVEKILERASREAGQIKERVIANGELRARDEILGAQRTVIARVFVKAKEELAKMDDKTLGETINARLAEVSLSKDAQVIVPKGKKASLSTLVKGNIQESDTLTSGFQIEEKGMRINYDFNQLVDYLKDDLEGEVHKLLAKK